MALRHAFVHSVLQDYGMGASYIGFCLKSVDGGAAPLTYGHAGRGSRLAIGAAVQLGRLLDPSVKIGSHADDVIWAERSGVSAEIICLPAGPE